MGHYDECREGYCEICGQAEGHCVHTAHMSNEGVQLKPCPFCKGGTRIAICDDEGNTRTEEYEDDPYSGLSYFLAHDHKSGADPNCPISTLAGDMLGRWIYGTKQEAAAAWNRRAESEG